MYRWQVMTRIAEQRVIGIVRADDAGCRGRRRYPAGDRRPRRGRGRVHHPGHHRRDPRADPRRHRLGRARRRRHGAGRRDRPARDPRRREFPRLPARRSRRHRDRAPVRRAGAARRAHHDRDPARHDRRRRRGQALPGLDRRPRGLRDIRGPLPQVPFVPTGGIAIDEAPAYIAAGAVAVGLGSALTAGSGGEIADRAGRLARRAAGGVGVTARRPAGSTARSCSITGGAQGIGRATVEVASREGATVAFFDLDDERGTETADGDSARRSSPSTSPTPRRWRRRPGRSPPSSARSTSWSTTPAATPTSTRSR